MDVGKPDADSSSDVSQELHVLAVDDSLVDRKVIERLLKISCCKVTAVESGRRALQYLGLDEEKSSAGFDDLKVNLIMTDYSMPEMTGFELLQKIKGSARLKEIPVVIMSSENILARIDRCLEEGAKDYLLKPVRLSDVKRVRDCILKGEHKNSKDLLISNREIKDGPLFPPPALQPPPTPPQPQPPTTPNCDAPMGLISVPVNCESPMSPIPGPGLPAEPHHGLLVKCPSLVVASD